jgi:hypothetical protein
VVLKSHSAIGAHRKVQIRNAKEVFRETVSLDQHGTTITRHRKTSTKLPGSKSMPTGPRVSGSLSGAPSIFSIRRARRAELRRNEWCALKSALYWDYSDPSGRQR